MYADFAPFASETGVGRQRELFCDISGTILGRANHGEDHSTLPFLERTTEAAEGLPLSGEVEAVVAQKDISG
jgi:hypothetical protein